MYNYTSGMIILYLDFQYLVDLVIIVESLFVGDLDMFREHSVLVLKKNYISKNAIHS